jgi:TrmH family RNA methyltransferase
VRLLGRTLAEGIHLAQAAIAANAGIEALLLRRGAQSAEIERVVATIRGVPAYELAPHLFNRLSPVQTSVGLMLELAVPSTEMPPRIAEDLIYLDGIQDPGNAGALLRTAAAAGVRLALAAPATTALWSPRVVRAAQGAHFAMKLLEGLAPDQAIERFAGRWIATCAHDAESLWASPLPASAVGWVLGAEGQGVSRAMLERCQQRICIPLAEAESLNVAAAAAVCLFERRRRLDPPQ